MSDITEMENKVKRFCDERDWNQFHNPKDLAIGVSTEANELLDLFRFKNEKQMAEMLENEEKRQLISEEIADVLFFILRFAQKYEFDLKRCLEEKLDKNGEKYPVDKVKGKNLKYTEY